MSQTNSPAIFSAKVDEKDSESSRTSPAARREVQLRGVIRVLINKNQRLQKPVLAAKQLAKHCQFLKEEVERLKQMSYNYKSGMERAERRSSHLQQDLARISRAAGPEAESDKSVGRTESPTTGPQFYLPASVKQIIDGLANSNIALMKSIQKMSDYGGNIDQILKKNLEMESLIKSLREELALKSSLLEEYEAEMSAMQPKSDADKLATNIILQRKECAELKSKIHSYEGYVKHLREKNSAIVDAIMTQLDKSNREPTESTDEEDKGAVARKTVSAPPSYPVSRASSGNGSRRDSLKSEYELCSTAIQTDSGFCTSSEKGSVDDVEMLPSLSEFGRFEEENKELKQKLLQLSDELQKRKEENKRAQERLTDTEQTWTEMATELEKWREQLSESEKKRKALEEEKEEFEAILQAMQDRVDQVNSANAGSPNLEERIREYEREIAELREKVNEVPMMQRELKNYEEEIKAYGIERKSLLDRIERLEYELNGVRKLYRESVLEHKMERQRSQVTSPGRQPGWPPQGFPQQRQYEGADRYQQKFEQDPIKRYPVTEPFKEANALWGNAGYMPRAQVVADGGGGGGGGGSSSGYRFDSAPEETRIHEGQRNRQLQRGGSQRRHGDAQGDNDDDNGGDDDFTNYANSGTVKCENCNERYPTSLFQDHFRDCSRDQSG